MSAQQQWVILIGGGYGAFLFEGTQEEAEDMRSHKARWERATGRKRLADAEEVASGKASHCLNHPGFNRRVYFVDCDCPDPNCVINAQERLTQGEKA